MTALAPRRSELPRKPASGLSALWRTAGGRRLDLETLTGVLAGALILGLGVVRCFALADQPLWLDEAFTAAISTEPRFTDFVRQVWWDANAPLWYLIEHLWTRAFGWSNASLRAPAVLFGLCAPFVIALQPVSGLSRAARWTWAGLIAAWIPGVWFSQDARCYTLLLLLGAAQAIAFAKLLREPTLRRATAWATLSSLLILTHYHALWLGACQGLLLLGLRRTRALRLWPAALAFAPAFAWLAVHWPRLQLFARPDVAWYAPLRWRDVANAGGFVFNAPVIWPEAAFKGFPVQPITVAVLLAAALAWRGGLWAWRRFKGRSAPATQPLGDAAVWWTVLSAVLGTAIMLGLGALRPSFVDRYLTPYVPALLLGIVAALQRFGRGRAWLVAVLAASAVVGGKWSLDALTSPGTRVYNFEVASRVLERARPTRLVFFWDHPATPIEAPEQLRALGGWFFKRDGRPIPVDAVQLKPGEDPNAVIEARAEPEGSAVLWMYDIGVHGTAARIERPSIAEDDPSFSCRQFGQGSIGVYACARTGGAPL